MDEDDEDGVDTPIPTPAPEGSGGVGRLRALAFVVGAVMVVTAVGLGVDRWAMRPSATAVAQQFLDARAAGDCDRLAGLVSHDSLEAHGVADRGEFVRVCAEVVDDFAADWGDREPPLPDVDIGYDNDATVYLDGEDGKLVREGRDWKVVVDGGFRLGRTPEQTLAAYLDAYHEGDCAAMAELWSAELQAEEGCDEALAARGPAPDVQMQIEPDDYDDYDDYDNTYNPDDHEGAETDREASVVAELTVQSPEVSYTFHQQVRMVDEGLTWRLDGSAAPGQALTALAAYDAARAYPLDDAAVGTGPSFVGVHDIDLTLDDLGAIGDEHEEAFRDAGFLFAVEKHQAFGLGGWCDVAILRFATPTDAAGHVEPVGDLIFADAYTDAERVPVPGLEGAVGLNDDQDGAYVVVAVEEMVVVVHVSLPPDTATPDGLAQATEIARAQLDRLADLEAGG